MADTHPKREPLSGAMVDLAQNSGLGFMDRGGVKYGVQLFKPSLFQAPPMIEMSGRDLLVFGTTHLNLWHLRLHAFYKNTPDGLLFYYIPLPRELEIPKEWRGEDA